NGQNVWETMKMAMLFQKQKLENANFGSAELALELMTRGGAAALHMEDRIGSLEPGKLADLIVIDTERVALTPSQTLISNLVYSPAPCAIQDVYVGGELVIENGQHARLDRAAVVARARAASERLLKSAGLDEYLRTRGRWRWEYCSGGAWLWALGAGHWLESTLRSSVVPAGVYACFLPAKRGRIKEEHRAQRARRVLLQSPAYAVCTCTLCLFESRTETIHAVMNASGAATNAGYSSGEIACSLPRTRTHTSGP